MIAEMKMKFDGKLRLEEENRHLRQELQHIQTQLQVIQTQTVSPTDNTNIIE